MKQTLTGLDEFGNPIKVDPVTQEELDQFAETLPEPAQRAVTFVTTEEEFRTALLSNNPICVDVVGELPLTLAEAVRIAVKGTSICGLGKDVTTLSIKTANPNGISFYLLAQNISIRDITLDSGFFNLHCVYGDCFNSISGATLDNVRITNTNDGFKYVGDINYPPCSNLTFRNSEIVNFKQKGMYLDIDLLNPVIENSYFFGYGNQESHTAIWIGNGILGGRITNLKIDNAGYNGLEVFYAYSDPTKSQLSRDNPHGPGVIISNLEISRIKNIACSLAGCKRSVISNIFIRNSGSGMEYIDEITAQDGVTLYSDYNASNVTVTGILGVGVTIHRMKRSRFTGHIMTDCGLFGCQVYDGADDITFQNSTFQRCGEKMLFANGSSNCIFTGNEFIKAPSDPPSFGFYAFGGTHIFSGNILRGGCRSGVSIGTIFVAPGIHPSISGDVFTDMFNYRFTS